MTEEKVVGQCEDLWKRVKKNSEPKHSYNESPREDDGTYVRGDRENIIKWTIIRGPYSVRIEEIRRSEFCFSSDKKIETRTLMVVRGDEEIFQAIQEGPTRMEMFGAEERYLGTKEIPATPWRVLKGEIPQDLKI